MFDVVFCTAQGDSCSKDLSADRGMMPSFSAQADAPEKELATGTWNLLKQKVERGYLNHDVFVTVCYSVS